MEDYVLYALSFENGANLFINAKNIEDAVGDGLSSLKACLPEEVKNRELVTLTAVRKCGGFCHVCGVDLRREPLSAAITVPADHQSLGMKICVSCARKIADAYEENEL